MNGQCAHSNIVLEQSVTAQMSNAVSILCRFIQKIDFEHVLGYAIRIQ